MSVLIQNERFNSLIFVIAFGAPAATSAPAFGGLNTTATATTQSAFGFGANTATSSAAPAFSGFGAQPTQSTGFGLGGNTFGGFGAPTSTGLTATTSGKETISLFLEK